MGYILSKYPDIHVVFTFSGSLLVQIEAYLNGSRDLRQVLSEKIASGERLSAEDIYDVVKIPGGFFDINWNRIVDQVPRYRQLRDYTQQILSKYKYLPDTEMMRAVASSYSEQDIIDLAVLFNLFWIDPEVLRDLYPDTYRLRQEALTNPNIHFTRQQLREILNIHLDIMKRIIPLYRSLVEKGSAELIPVPYSHPLSPIIVDFGWSTDLYIHSIKSIDLFKKYFNYTPAGVWPAEQAVNEYVIKIFSYNFTWSISDQAVLGKSGVDANNPQNLYSLWFIDFGEKRFYMFFRDTTLSNLISFEYSRYDPKQAVNDLISRLLNIKKIAPPGSIVVVALDGENPWENYIDFGDPFLNNLYSSLTDLQKSGVIKTITGREYVSKFYQNARKIPVGERLYLDLVNVDISDIPISYSEDAYNILPRARVNASLAEGSWAGGELTMWIGQRQENAAWMWLKKTREDLLRKYGARDISDLLNKNPLAVEYLLRAEASDWFWWYGGDAGGGFPANPLYKTYLRKVYELSGSEAPDYLYTSFNPDATPVYVLNTETPRPLEKPPRINGLYEANEWINSLNISIGSLFPNALVAVDPSNIYIMLRPSSKDLLRNTTISISVYLTTPWKSVSPYHLGYNSFPRGNRVDLGMGLFNEIRIIPSNNSGAIYTADGYENWVYMYPLQSIAVGDVIELSAPWSLLGLRSRDLSYLTIAVYVGNKLVETSTRMGLVYQVLVPSPMVVAGEKILVEFRDPEGDDKGPGTYVYPTADVFKPGVFDLLGFRVLDRGSKIVIEVFVRDLGGNPWNGPNGFCLQYVQIYIRTTLNLPTRNDTYGLNVYLADNSSWHIAILLAPGWGSDPVPKGERAAIYYYNDTVIVQGESFVVYADPSRNAIVAEIDKSLLFDLENVPKWVFTVALTSYDGYGPDRVRPVGVDAGTWVIGAGAKMAQAILKGVEPRIMDLLAPTAEDQYRMLSSFRVSPEPLKAVIYGLNYSLVSTRPVAEKTITYTITYTTTATSTQYITHTEIFTATKEYTKATTLSTVYTEKVYETPLMNLILVFLAGLVIGVIIFVLTRRFIK
jgi:alpha-amylase/alpha-mannosidase (GH57 family)